MKPRIDIIEFCGDCSRRYYEVNDLHCELTGDCVSENLLIPDNCPLPIKETTPIKIEKLFEISNEATKNERERVLNIIEKLKKEYKKHSIVMDVLDCVKEEIEG